MSTRTVTLHAAAAVLLLLVGWQLGALHERFAQTGVMVNPMSTLIEPGASASGVTTEDPRHDVDVSLLWDTWDQLVAHYVDPQKLQVTPLVYGAAAGLVRAIGDPYTVFMTPDENTSFRNTLAGDLDGIGAELSVHDNLIVVVSPLKGSPAEKAGLRAKDVITQVDGQSIQGWDLNQVVEHIRGPKGSTVRLRVARPNAGNLDFTIMREEIHVPSVESHIIQVSGKTYGYAALNQFGEGSVQELTTQLRSFKDKNVQGIILDLRDNGGGYLDGAVDLVSLFVRQGNVVTVAGRGDQTETHEVSGNVFLPDTPLVVLQNENTASASEIVSGALQDYGRATIVGKKSFGKGTVQEVIDLPGGSSLRVTVARWLTPKGKNLGKEGVHPDIDVDPAAPGTFDANALSAWDWKIDPQIAAGVNVLLGKKAK